MHKKSLKFAPNEAKFYLYHGTRIAKLYHGTGIAKTGPGFDDPPEHSSVQIDSSTPWLM